MPSRTDESSPDSTCCSPEREAQSLGDLGFGKSAPQTECDHMDETDCVAAIRIGKGHLFFSRSVQTSPQECHTVAQGSSKNKKRRKNKSTNNNNNKPKRNPFVCVSYPALCTACSGAAEFQDALQKCNIHVK